MSKVMKRLAISAFLFCILGAFAGCGGGPLRTGGLGILGVSNLPDQPISMDDLPPAVRTNAEAVIAGKKLQGIIRNARPRDGKWYYTITYSDQDEAVKRISYWGDGAVRPLKD